MCTMDNVVLFAKYLVSTICLFLISAGWGEWMLVVTRTRLTGRSGFLDRTWLGICAIASVLQVWHFLLPVNTLAALTVFSAGVLGVWRYLRSGSSELRSRRTYVQLVLLAVTCVPVFVALPGTPDVYDSGMYHLQSIRWANEYAIVPGIGNLNIQFAANQSYFLLAALLNIQGLSPFGYQFLNAFLILAAISYSLEVIAIGLCKKSELSITDVFRVLFLPLYAAVSVNVNTRSASPDFMAWILVLVLSERTVVASRLPLERDGFIRSRLLLPVVLGVLCVTVKLSTLSFVGLVFALVCRRLVELIWRGRSSITRVIVASFPVACSALLMFGVWIGRGILQSGYWFYPLSRTQVDVDWRIRKSTVDVTRWYMGVWGRVCDSTPGDAIGQAASAFEKSLGLGTDSVDVLPPKIPYFTRGRWRREWGYELSRNPAIQHTLVIVTVCLPLVALLGFAISRRIKEPGWPWVVLLPVGGTVFCYFSAPNLRFYFPYVLLMVPWSLAWLSVQLPAWIGRSGVLVGAVAIAAAAVTWEPVVQKMLRSKPAWAATLQMPNASLREMKTASGLHLNTPVQDKRVYNAELPATPYFNQNLELRNPAAGLQAGFRISNTDEPVRYGQ